MLSRNIQDSHPELSSFSAFFCRDIRDLDVFDFYKTINIFELLLFWGKLRKVILRSTNFCNNGTKCFYQVFLLEIPIACKSSLATNYKLFQLPLGYLKQDFIYPLVWANITKLGKSPRGWGFFFC